MFEMDKWFERKFICCSTGYTLCSMFLVECETMFTFSYRLAFLLNSSDESNTFKTLNRAYDLFLSLLLSDDEIVHF